MPPREPSRILETSWSQGFGPAAGLPPGAVSVQIVNLTFEVRRKSQSHLFSTSIYSTINELQNLIDVFCHGICQYHAR
jgi:hypothetical protein